MNSKQHKRLRIDGRKVVIEILEEVLRIKKKRNLTMAKLSIEVGINRNQLDKYFSGQVDIKAKDLFRLTNLFEIQMLHKGKKCNNCGCFSKSMKCEYCD